MSLCCFALISSEMFQPVNRFWYKFVGQVMKNVIEDKKNQSCSSYIDDLISFNNKRFNEFISDI